MSGDDVVHVANRRGDARVQLGWRRRLPWLIVIVVIAVGMLTGIRRGLQGRPDWPLFRDDSRAVWQQQRSSDATSLFGYLPAAVFALWPYTVLSPEPLGLVLFAASNGAAAAASVWIVRRWWIPRAGDGAFTLAVVLVGANLAHAIQANQLTLWTLVLCAGGLTLVGQRREFVGGGVLGLAGLIKVMPFCLAGLLLIGGRKRALAGMAAAVVAFDLLPSVLFFGWDGAIREHRAWLRRAEWHSNARLIDDPLLRVHRHGHNMAYSLLLGRWLRPARQTDRQLVLYGGADATSSATRPTSDSHVTVDPMPHVEPGVTSQEFDISWVPRFHLAELSGSTVKWIWSGSLVAGFVALVSFTWRRTSAIRARRASEGLSSNGAKPSLARRARMGRSTPCGTDSEWYALAALWMLAMFWPSPMLRHYYLAMAFPAIALVAAALGERLRDESRRWSAGMLLAAAALSIWGIGVICLGSYAAHNMRWYGLHVLALAVLMAATVWCCRRNWRHSATRQPAPPGAKASADRTAAAPQCSQP